MTPPPSPSLPSGDGGDECGAGGSGLLLHLSGHHQCEGQRRAEDLLCPHRDEPLSVTGERSDMRSRWVSQSEKGTYIGHPIIYSDRCRTSNQQNQQVQDSQSARATDTGQPITENEQAEGIHSQQNLNR